MVPSPSGTQGCSKNPQSPLRPLLPLPVPYFRLTLPCAAARLCVHGS